MDQPDHLLRGSASLDKGLALLSRIVEDRGRTSIGQLAGDLALPISTAHRLIATLVRHGLVARVGRGSYDVGLALVRNLSAVPPAEQLGRISRPALKRLARATGATVHLGVLENDMVTYLVKETGRSTSAGASFTRENGQLEAYCSAVGKILLAALPEQERERYLAEGSFVALTPRTVVDPDHLRHMLRMVSAEGMAVDDGEIADDLFCLAVPLADQNGDVIGAISLSVAMTAKDHARDNWIAPLRECASEICRRIGPPWLTRL